MAIAAKKLKVMSCECTMSKFSHVRGNPTSSHGNFSWITRIWSPDSVGWSITALKRAALCGVVNMVMIMPSCASNLAMSINGIMWPGAINGNNAK